MANPATKVGPKYQVCIPRKVRDAVGLEIGDLVEAEVGPNDTIILHPKTQLIIEKVDLRSLDKRTRRELEKAMAAADEGKTIGPFDSADDALKAALKHSNARRDD